MVTKAQVLITNVRIMRLSDEQDNDLSPKDQFDTDAAEHLVLIGYPSNKAYLAEMITWSCFPNDPVCFTFLPYVSVLKDEILIPAMEEHLRFHLANNQESLADTAYYVFIDGEREHIIADIIKLTTCNNLKRWLEKKSCKNESSV